MRNRDIGSLRTAFRDGGMAAAGAVCGSAGLATIVALFVAAFLLGGFCLEYTVETWAAFFGNPVDVPFPHIVTIIGGAILAKLFVPAAILTWVATFFM